MKKDKDEPYKMTRDQVVIGIRLCILDVRQLLKDSESLLTKKGNSSTSLGLYTFAIEEFGKAIHLKSCIKKIKKEYDIPRRIFYDHNYKFNKALAILPKESKSPVLGVEIEYNPNSTPQTIEISPKGEKISISGGVSGIFSLSNDDFKANFEARLNCFYNDWDNNAKRWKIKSKILSRSIKDGISKFNKVLDRWETSIK